ncbi:MAG: MBL fold metallo-hydrolase [Desulfobacterales bacterium]|nr:MBL fold metallo-hydrolase [Desulfobacterales bacterium]
MRENKSSLRVCPLASGSKGNSVFIATPETSVLIDAGLSGVELQRRMDAVGEDPSRLSAIIVTHEHSDHVKGAGILSRRFDIPLHITPSTHAACKGLGKVEHLEYFHCGNAFDIGDLTINPFSVSHDADDPAGLTLSHGGHKVGFATDLGIVTNLVRAHLSQASLLYIESNHDMDMLMQGAYPWYLKQRIKSRRGHLSNRETRQLVTDLIHPGLQHVILAHLSEENNHPDKAYQEVGQCLENTEISLSVAGPEAPGQMIQLG